MDDPAGSPDTARPRVAVVFGGRSSEHGVSCVTAAGVLRAIDRARYDVVAIGITVDGRWVLAPDDPARLDVVDGKLPQVDPSGDDVLLPTRTTSRALVTMPVGQVPSTLGDVDVVFPVLHGPFGEDGTLQGMLELADIRYVGSGVLASAAGMDKHHMKLVLAGSGLPIGAYTVLLPGAWHRDRDEALGRVAALGLPVFVKPARAGSSIGISRVERLDDLDAAVEAAALHDPKVVVEAAVDGREVECAVLGAPDGERPSTSEVGEIEVLAGHAFYDFDAKYLDDANVRLSCPADLEPAVAARVRRLAADAFVAFGCEGLARVDFFVRPDGDVVVNEINTMPGFTPHSMYPRMWAASGLDYPALVDRLVQLALLRPTGLR